MYVKAMTLDCEKCSLLKVKDNGDFLCSWGKSKRPKKLNPPVGKTPLHCNLIKKSEQ